MPRGLSLSAAVLAACLLAGGLARAEGDCQELVAAESYGDLVVGLGPVPGAVSAWGSRPGWVSHWPVPQADDAGTALVARQAVATSEALFVLLEDGRVLSWGSDSESLGVLGRPIPGGGTRDDTPGFVRAVGGVGELTGVRSLAAGARHVLARLDDSTLVAWGDGRQGQLGGGTYLSSPWPMQVLASNGSGPLESVGKMAAGEHHSLVVLGTGSLWCFGSNDSGQCGNGVARSSVPREVLSLPSGSRFERVAGVAAGAHHSYAWVYGDGALYAWGRNDSGQLGIGTETNSDRPVHVLDELGEEPLTGVSAAAGGESHGLAVSWGRLLSWGSNSRGQLGSGLPAAELPQRSLPGPVLSGPGVELEGAVRLDAGAAHSFAVRHEPGFQLHAWGAGEAGQLADGRGRDALFARRVGAILRNEPSALDLEPTVEPLRVATDGDGLRVSWSEGSGESTAVVAGSLDVLRSGAGFDTTELTRVDVPERVGLVDPPLRDVWFLAVGACEVQRTSAGRDSAGVERDLQSADPDRDGDGVDNVLDVCPDHHDPFQQDYDRDGIGDACDPDHVVPDAQWLSGGAGTSPAAGGMPLHVLGADFEAGDQLRISGQDGRGVSQACEVELLSPEELTAVSPRHFTAAGPFPVDVDLLAQRDVLLDPDSALRSFDGRPLRYYANPTLLGALAPDGSALAQPGETVLVLGTNFRPELDVFVDRLVLANSGALDGRSPGEESFELAFEIVDNNQLRFVFPETALLDFWDLRLSTPNAGLSCVDAYTFTLQRAVLTSEEPALLGMEPVRGTFLGGTEVVLSGHFPEPVTSVTFDGIEQAVVAQDSTTLRLVTVAVVEDDAGLPVDVVVTAPGGSLTLEEAYTFVPEPDVTSVNVTTPICGVVTAPPGPLPVQVGTVLQVLGEDLIGITEAWIGDEPAALWLVTENEVHVEVPPVDMLEPPALDLRLIVGFEPGPTGRRDPPFEWALPEAVRFTRSPFFWTMWPRSARAGESVSVYAFDALEADGSWGVFRFGDSVVPPEDISPGWEENELVLVVPPGEAGETVTVSLETCSGHSNRGDIFTYRCDPPSGALDTSTGATGLVVGIDGSLLLSGDVSNTHVSFGLRPAEIDEVRSTAERLVVTVPWNAPMSTVDVTVRTCDGYASSDVAHVGSFTYECAEPTITALSDTQGRAGQEISILGSGLIGEGPSNIEVLFGSVPAFVNLWGSTDDTVVVTVPEGSGAVDVTVRTCGGETVFTASPFSYCEAPALDSLSPSEGPVGTVVELVGGALLMPEGQRPNVWFGDQLARVLESPAPTATQVSVEAPVGFGTVDVTVQTCGGSYRLRDSYTYP